MDYFSRKELEEFKGEIEAKDIALESAKAMFALDIENGMSEDIIKTLINPQPIKQKKTCKLKLYFKRFFKN